MIPNQTFTGALSAPFAATPEFTGTIDSWSGRLPPGLSINAASGLISGTPTARGIFSAPKSITGAQYLRAQKIARSDWGLKLAIKEDGSLFSWGFESYENSSYTPAIAPPAIANVVDVAVSHFAFLALKSDGTVVAWRETSVDPSADYITPPAGLSGVVSIAAGFVQFLALKNNGTVVAWGLYDNTTGIKAIPAGLSGVVAISLGSDHTALALKNNGTVVAWGGGYTEAQIMAGGTLLNIPPEIADLEYLTSPVVAISISDSHALALRADGSIIAWGANSHGQCNIPSGLSNVVAIESLNDRSVALKSDGTLEVWGKTFYNSLFPGDDYTAPTDVVAVSKIAGGYHALKSNGTVVQVASNTGERGTRIIPGYVHTAEITYVIEKPASSFFHDGEENSNLTIQARKPFSAFPTFLPTFTSGESGEYFLVTQNNWVANGLPTGLSINGTTGEISGTVDQLGQSGTASITHIIGFNTPAQSSSSYSLDYIITRAAPVLKLNQTFNLSFGQTPVVFLRNLLEDPLETYSDWSSFTVSGLPSWASFSSTGEYTGSAPPENGTWLCDVTVSGATGSDSGTFTLVVSSAPIIDPDQSFSGKVTSGSGLPLNAQITTQDPENRPATSWSATGLPPGLSINATGRVSGYPTTAGEFTASITATGPGGSDTESVAFSIAVGEPLIANNPNFTGRIGINFQTTVTAENPTNRPVTSWSASGLPSWATFNADTAVLSGVPTSDADTTVTFTATGPGGTSSRSFILKIDSLPGGTIVLGIFVERVGDWGGTDLRISGTQFSGNGFSWRTEPFAAGDTGTIPPGMSIVPENNSSANIRGTPSALGRYKGQAIFEFFGETQGGDDFDIRVIAPPQINSGQSYPGIIGTAFSATAQATDLDNRPVTSWAATGLPGWAAISTSGNITGTPTAVGEFQFSLVAMGPAGTATQTALIVVAYNVPLFAYPLLTTLQTGEQASIAPSITDATNRPITSWAATGLPAGLTLNTSSGEITGAPTAAGSFTATITATGPGGSSTQTIEFTVLNTFPIFRGGIRATAIYAGATQGKAIYYGPSLLWNVPGWEPLPSAASFAGAAAGDEFGYSVAMNSRGNRIVIGARRNDAGGTNAGAVSVFESAGTWSQLGVDIIGPEFESFGGTVCMNATGDIIAARGSGKVRVYEWTGSSWAQRGSQITQLSGSPNAATAQFGIGLALSAAGDVLAIGAPDGLDYSGYTEVYAWSGSAWSLRGTRILSEVSGDRSGQSVSLSADGTRIAIGARYADPTGTSSGHARVLEWSGSAWTQVGASIPGAAAGDEAGYSVSLNSAGTRIAIGARYHSTPARNAGQVRVFEEVNGAWVQLGQSMNGEAIDSWSGCSVSLNTTGDIVAIGAERNNGDAGHVRIYQWNGTSWQQQGGDIDGDAGGDRLGFSVALNGAGTLLIAGAPYSDALGTSTGSAKVIPLPAAP